MPEREAKGWWARGQPDQIWMGWCGGGGSSARRCGIRRPTDPAELARWMGWGGGLRWCAAARCLRQGGRRFVVHSGALDGAGRPTSVAHGGGRGGAARGGGRGVVARQRGGGSWGAGVGDGEAPRGWEVVARWR